MSPASGATPIGPARPVTAAVAAVSVGLLASGTLCTVAGMIVGATAHLVGIPDAWAQGLAAVTAAACLVPCAALARRAWHAERRGADG